MAYKINKTDFFKKNISDEVPDVKQPEEQSKFVEMVIENPEAEQPESVEMMIENPELEEGIIIEPEEEEPKSEEPEAEKPKAEKPKAEKPMAEKPKAEKPMAEKPKTEKPMAEKPKSVKSPVVAAEPFKVGSAVVGVMSDSAKLLMESGFKELAVELAKVKQSAERERFTVAVTGEFSRGKSTFINKLLGKEFLPVSDLPTTALMTRIRYHQQEVLLYFNEKNEKKAEKKLSKEAWENLVIDNFGDKEVRGWALVGLNSQWLKDTNIEIIDTPGAGDLSENRAKSIGDMLLGCDGAIITVSATSPLSLTEKLFIEERLLARKMPFLLLALTKLDQVKKEERAGIIRYVKTKLAGWGMDIPVYVPYDVEMEDDEFKDIIGLDKIKNKIQQWYTCGERVDMTENWLLEKTEGLIKQGVLALGEKKLLLEEADEKKRAELIAEKESKLSQAELVWGEYRLKMNEKCSKCYDMLLSKVDDYADTITERLQYEASHAGNPQKWWNEDFPYRVKIELTNLSVSIENIVSRQIEADARWYSSAIEKTFHSYVLYEKQTISDKSFFGSFDIGGNVELKDLDKQRTAFRVGAAVLSISGFALFSALGFLPIVATVGIGTGTSIISEKIFKNKVEEQREALKKEIAKCVPIFIQESMKESEKRLESVYEQMIQEAEKTQNTWLEAQRATLSEIKNPKAEEQVSQISQKLEKLQKQAENVHAMMVIKN